jgi:RNA polymerase sigma factor (sigma-70 family)
MKFSDAELLNGLVNREEIVLREFYGVFFQSIRRFVLTNSGSEEDAKDLFQEALMVIFQKARDKNFKLTCSMGTYLYSVSRFLWLKELGKRKQVRGKPVDLEDFIDTGADIYEISEYNERLHVYRTYFERLSEDCKRVLTLFMEGHTIAEITSIMGYSSEQHTRNRRYRCKLSLIERIRNDFGNEITGYGNNTID